MNKVGPKVNELRQAKNWTQDQLAAKCNLIGFNLSRGTLAKIESKTRKVSDFEVELLAKALQVEVGELFNFESNS